MNVPALSASLRASVPACLRAFVPLCLLLSLLSLPSCQLIGGMAASAARTAKHNVPALYKGLGGKSFAVLVSADRTVQGEHPGLVEFVHQRVTERLSDKTNVPRAGGFVPSSDVLSFTARNPGWPAKPMAELATSLGGVDRLVLVELGEFRLTEPGNIYEWNGAAAANVSVFELDGGTTKSELAVLDRTVTVTFPDKKSVTPTELPQQAVTTELARRIIDRVSWMFYDHEELVEIPY